MVGLIVSVVLTFMMFVGIVQAPMAFLDGVVTVDSFLIAVIGIIACHHSDYGVRNNSRGITELGRENEANSRFFKPCPYCLGTNATARTATIEGGNLCS